jgi:hypothetical protein
VSAVEKGVQAIALRVVQPDPFVGVPAALLVRAEHVQRGPLAVVGLDEESRVPELPREAEQVVRALEAGAMIHGGPPATPASGEVEPGLPDLAAEFERTRVQPA